MLETESCPLEVDPVLFSSLAMTFELGFQFLDTIVEIDSWAKGGKSMWAK